MTRSVLILLLLVLQFERLSASAQTQVQDIFGRSLNNRGITLVDWDGYMANPLIKIYLLPPTNVTLPGSATLSANGARLYFGMPSNVSATGPDATISFTNFTTPVPVTLSIFPAHESLDDVYTLTIVFTGAHNKHQTNTVPIQVIDQDAGSPNAFVVTPDFSQDSTVFFENPTARQLVTQAANDWTYYFTGMKLDAVAAGTEKTYIWHDNFSGGYDVNNSETYTGFLLYAYGTTNATDISGGEGSYDGKVQTSGGVPLTMKRSGGFEANIIGNYNTLGWLFLTNDDDWLVSQNLGNQTNDFYSIAHHEIGHALIFNQAHPGFATALSNGAFTSAAVTNYYSGPAPIDASNDHLTGVIDPESGQGAFGYEYYGSIPRNRWTMTKIDLLCAQEVGYVLRPSSAFAPFVRVTNSAPMAFEGVPYNFQFAASGGIPIYAWDITAGALPPGLELDAFAGTLSGTPTSAGMFNFTVRVRDYHENTAGLTQDLTMTVAAPVQLTISAVGGTVKIIGTGSPGQRQILELSTNLVDWNPIATNILVSNSFQVAVTNILSFPCQYFRALTPLE